ncbi:MAG: hypothetical protein KDD35_05155, partial [Bdellovibrionales bacterium]|nr:hypothetical protein [Bdellovibrionales bacterium]
KFIVLLEEIDKIGEIDPFGGPKDRPIITVVKDIIDRGRASATTKEQMSIVEHIVQVSDAYIFATMNFDGKIFDFKADPRLTTARDMIKAWEHIEANKASLKEVLEKMFRPDTISRFLPITHVIRPLEAQHYFQVINAQIEKIIRERFSDSEGKDNGKIEIRLSESYQNYLFRETVIPSEGARYTVDISRRLLNRDLENALTHLPRYLRSVPLSIQFQFLSDSSTVFATVQPRDKSHPETEVFRTPVQLMFPDPRIFGKLPADRVLNAAHEFGHAYTAVRLGLRIEVVSSVSPMSGVGGYVKYSGNNSEAMAFIARVYANLGSRALERIVLSAKPLQKRSVMDITSGSTSDIEKATETLYTALFKLGFDPNGGTVDAQGGKPDRHDKYVDFAELPYKTVERLGEILREMEDFLVQDLLNANDIEWYKDKILKLARTGIVDETELYQLLEYKAPGREGNSPGLLSRVYEVFGNEILDIDTDETRAARVFRQGSEMRTARDNLKVYVNVFERILENSLHQNNAQRMPTDSCPKWLSTLK